MNDVAQAGGQTTVTVAGIALEVTERGHGSPILYLHGGGGISGDLPFIDLLAKQHRVIAPSHPGFGRSGLPDWLDSVDDIAHVHLELMNHFSLSKVDLIGMSVGGWIAAEIATKIPERLQHLVLIGPVGVKTGPVDKLDLPDIFATPQDKMQRLLFHDPDKMRPDVKSMTDEQLGIMVRNRETMALIGWEPYLHNPKLKHRLHRVNAPTLFLRGVSDGVVTADYVERYARLIPRAQSETIAAAGHAPQVEQPQATAARILDFLKS